MHACNLLLHNPFKSNPFKSREKEGDPGNAHQVKENSIRVAHVVRRKELVQSRTACKICLYITSGYVRTSYRIKLNRSSLRDANYQTVSFIFPASFLKAISLNRLTYELLPPSIHVPPSTSACCVAESC